MPSPALAELALIKRVRAAQLQPFLPAGCLLPCLKCAHFPAALCQQLFGGTACQATVSAINAASATAVASRAPTPSNALPAGRTNSLLGSMNEPSVPHSIVLSLFATHAHGR